MLFRSGPDDAPSGAAEQIGAKDRPPWFAWAQVGACLKCALMLCKVTRERWCKPGQHAAVGIAGNDDGGVAVGRVPGGDVIAAQNWSRPWAERVWNVGIGHKKSFVVPGFDAERWRREDGITPACTGAGDCVGGESYFGGHESPWRTNVFGGREVCGVDAEVLCRAARVGGVAFDVVSGHRLFSGVRDAALEDDGGRIHRCGEATGVGGVIAEMQWCGV